MSHADFMPFYRLQLIDVDAARGYSDPFGHSLQFAPTMGTASFLRLDR